MKYHSINLLLVLAAVVCYFVGFGDGIVPLIAAYFVLELTLGLRLRAKLRRRLRGGT